MGCSALDRANFALSRETRDMLAAAIDSMGGPPVDKHKAPPRPAPPLTFRRFRLARGGRVRLGTGRAPGSARTSAGPGGSDAPAPGLAGP
jgi:hypothetical protein